MVPKRTNLPGMTRGGRGGRGGGAPRGRGGFGGGYGPPMYGGRGGYGPPPHMPRGGYVDTHFLLLECSRLTDRLTATAEDIEDALGDTIRTEQGQRCGKESSQMFRTCLLRWEKGIMAFLCQVLQERRRFKTSKEA